MTDVKINSDAKKQPVSSRVTVLFKAEHNEERPDPYIEELQKLGLDVTVIPVLKFNFVNVEILRQNLQTPDDYSGIIFTSIRAVEAVYNALQFYPENEKAHLIEKWNEKENFSVGEATAKSANLKLQLVTKGQEMGNGEKLVNFILKGCFHTKIHFLFPCSNIRKETVPSLLKSQGFSVKEVVCYETVPDPHIQDSLQTLFQVKGAPEILVFFSPSGVQYTLPFLQTLYQEMDLCKCVALGPSTEQALYEAGLQPWKVAKKPNPKGLYEALNVF